MSFLRGLSMLGILLLVGCLPLKVRRLENIQFRSQPPAQGDILPALTAYTPTGAPMALADLKGKYTVLVFGCLT